jgi:hypothetical protein
MWIEWISFTGRPKHEQILHKIKEDLFFDPNPNENQAQQVIKLITQIFENGEKAKLAPKVKTAFPELQGAKKLDVAAFPTISSVSSIDIQKGSIDPIFREYIDMLKKFLF